MLRPLRSLVPAALLLTRCFSPSGAGSGATTGGGSSTSSGDATIEPAVTGATGPSTSSTSSTSSGTTPVCGNGITEEGEACDDGENNDANAECTPECASNRCGDGYLCTDCKRSEECDEGDVDPDDGCSATCLREHLFAFVSSKTYVGSSLGGLQGADQACQELAGAHFHPDRKFVAWMTLGESMLYERVGKSSLPYVLPDGSTMLATDSTAFVGGPLLAPISVTEANLGLGPPGDCSPMFTVWTGVDLGGTPNVDNCSGWSGPGAGLVGEFGQMDMRWTQACARDCTEQRRIYCVESVL